MKAYIFLAVILSFFMSNVAFGDDMDGQPEVAPVAGELIGNDPVQQVECKNLKQDWKKQYHDIKLLEKKGAYVSEQQQKKLDDTTNSMMGTGCLQNTDKLKQEVEDGMKD